MAAISNDRSIYAAPVTGYLNHNYANSLTEVGTPYELPRSKGWILERRIPEFPDHDAMGCYPLFVCQDWAQLNADLEDIGNKVVSLSVVTDPFGDYDEAYLKSCFRDVIVPFKSHFVVDLSCPPDTFVHPHHRRNARKALRQLHVEQCARPENFLDDWTALYQELIEKHQIKGVAAFTKKSFAKQLAVPGMVMFRATHDNTTVGMLLWYAQDDLAYYHLGAYSTRGYELRASFALFNYSIEYFARHGFRWLNLGGGVGVGTNGTSGLSRFKHGWATGTRMAYFCGRIFDQEKYIEIARAKGIPSTEYFPAYRLGEFQ